MVVILCGCFYLLLFLYGVLFLLIHSKLLLPLCVGFVFGPCFVMKFFESWPYSKSKQSQTTDQPGVSEGETQNKDSYRTE